MDGQRSNMLTYLTCTHSRWFKHWGEKLTCQIFPFFWQKWTTRLTFQNCLTLCANKDVHNGSHSRNKFSVELQLQISVPQWYDALCLQTMLEKAESQRISLCSCVVSGTVYTHIQMFTFHCILLCLRLLKMYLTLCFGRWIWRVLVPVNQISLFTIWRSVYLIGHIFIIFFFFWHWNWITHWIIFQNVLLFHKITEKKNKIIF